MDKKNTVPMGQFPAACGSFVEVTEKSTQHLEAHPEVASILVAAINLAVIGDRPFAEIEVDMGRVIGRKNLVAMTACSPHANAEFAIRKGRSLPSRVVTGVTEGDETSSVVIIVKWARPGHYVLITSWIGNLAQKEPWDNNIHGEAHFGRCLQFWCANALIHDPEVMGPVFRSSWVEVLQGREKEMGGQRCGFNRNRNGAIHKHKRHIPESALPKSSPANIWGDIDFLDRRETTAGSGVPTEQGTSRDVQVCRHTKPTAFKSPSDITLESIYTWNSSTDATGSSAKYATVSIKKRRPFDSQG